MMDVNELLSRYTAGQREFPGVDLTGARLIDADLSQANFSGAKLARAELAGAILQEADLSGADLSDADLRRTDLLNADLTRANLTNADLSEARLVHAVLEGTIWDGASLRSADLTRARRADGAALHKAADLTDARLPEARTQAGEPASR
jgi:uncharacterized protein YjbI with pentapeptide repeats